MGHVLGSEGIALGLHGPNLSADIVDADRLISVDVSDIVHSHGIHAYLASLPFQNHLRDILVADDV